MSETSIEWTDATWNPVRGCRRVSPGCENCYAERQAHRFSGPGRAYDGLTKLTKRGPVWTGEARFVPDMLDAPLKWRTPQRVFVNSMSDLFHEGLTDQQIAAVFGVMAICPQHTFQVLTKRPERMLRWFESAELSTAANGQTPIDACLWAARSKIAAPQAIERLEHANRGHRLGEIGFRWPLPNVWLGVSAEDQQRADERIPLLLMTPAAVRFVSMEPLLEEIYFTWRLKPANPCVPEAGTHERGLDWVIVGGESGPGARPCNVGWIGSIVNQCAEEGVSCFVKQLGARPVITARTLPINGKSAEGLAPYLVAHSKGGDIDEFPLHLRVRQFPEARHG